MAADAQRASAIIRRLRALSRKEHASQRGLDLNQLVDNVVILLRYDLARKEHHGAPDRGPRRAARFRRSIQLQQVILNLLVNASEAIGNAPDGPREIAITTALRAPGLAEVRVRDTGVGANAADLERMFERFAAPSPAASHGPGDQPVDRGGARWASRAETNPDRGLRSASSCRATARFRTRAHAAGKDQPGRMDQQRIAGDASGSRVGPDRNRIARARAKRERAGWFSLRPITTNDRGSCV